MHLGDYNTSRNEIRVYCWRHLPKNRKHVTLWKIEDAQDWVKKEYSKLYEQEKRFINKTIAVKPLTQNAKDHSFQNHPNLILEMRRPGEGLD